MTDAEAAREIALRALRARDRSAVELDARLRDRGVVAEVRRDVLAELGRVGYLDDERLAHARATLLAERGAGDALIRADLDGRGVAAELVEAALDRLEPERARAEAVLARRGAGPKTLRYLAARGFGDDVLESIAQGDGRAVG